jgi:hypothetical protein
MIAPKDSFVMAALLSSALPRSYTFSQDVVHVRLPQSFKLQIPWNIGTPGLSSTLCNTNSSNEQHSSTAVAIVLGAIARATTKMHKSCCRWMVRCSYICLLQALLGAQSVAWSSYCGIAEAFTRGLIWAYSAFVCFVYSLIS